MGRIQEGNAKAAASKWALSDPALSLWVEKMGFGKVELEHQFLSHCELRGATDAQGAGRCADAQMDNCLRAQQFNEFDNAANVRVRISIDAQVLRSTAKHDRAILKTLKRFDLVLR